MTNYHAKYVKLMDDYIDQSYTYGSCLKEIQDLKGDLSVEQFIRGSLRFELSLAKAKINDLSVVEGTVKRLIEEMIS